MDSGFYDIHIFCCVNERRQGHPRGSCARKGSEALRDYMKMRGKALRPALNGRRVRVNQAGCLDRCELGPTMVIYPDGVWYHFRSKDDIDEILERHVLNGDVVERLVLSPDQTHLNDPVADVSD